MRISDVSSDVCSSDLSDDDQANARRSLDICKQLQYLSLDRDIQRRGRFVGYEQIRFAQQGHGDHDTLTQAAGQLVRILIETLSRRWDTHLLEQLKQPPPGLAG